jgi:hypothetical protein
MRVTWVPLSASSLVAGAAALSVAALLTPMTSGSETLTFSDFEGSRYLVVAFVYFVTACALTLGLPSILTLFRKRNRLGLVAIGVFVVGCLGIAGYAMLLVFMRALAVTHSTAVPDLTGVGEDAGLLGFVYGWVAAFYLGELLLAIALIRATSTPRWIPAVLIAHVVLLPFSGVLPASIQAVEALLITVGLAGVGVFAGRQYRQQPA